MNFVNEYIFFDEGLRDRFLKTVADRGDGRKGSVCGDGSQKSQSKLPRRFDLKNRGINPLRREAPAWQAEHVLQEILPNATLHRIAVPFARALRAISR